MPIQEKQELLSEAFALYMESADAVSRKDAIKVLKDRAPGFSDRQYRSAWSRVCALFDNACRLVFRWANDNEPGTNFELPDKERVFLDNLSMLSQGFNPEQYDAALAYGFKRAIF